MQVFETWKSIGDSEYVIGEDKETSRKFIKQNCTLSQSRQICNDKHCTTDSWRKIRKQRRYGIFRSVWLISLRWSLRGNVKLLLLGFFFPTVAEDLDQICGDIFSFPLLIEGAYSILDTLHVLPRSFHLLWEIFMTVN